MRHKGQQRRDDKPWQSQNGANPGKEKRINSKERKGTMEDEKAKEGMLINKKRSEKEKTMLTWLFSDKAETGETIWRWNKSKQGRWGEQEIERQLWRKINGLEEKKKSNTFLRFSDTKYKCKYRKCKLQILGHRTADHCHPTGLFNFKSKTSEHALWTIFH